MAASQGHDSVVLGAFGCGYFRNPASAVAETFRKLLSAGGEFEHVFHLVVFAVIHGNVEPFSERFPLVKAKTLPSSKRLLATAATGKEHKSSAKDMEGEVGDQDPRGADKR